MDTHTDNKKPTKQAVSEEIKIRPGKSKDRIKERYLDKEAVVYENKNEGIYQ